MYSEYIYRPACIYQASQSAILVLSAENLWNLLLLK